MYEDYMDNLFDRRPMPTVAPKVGDIFLYTVNRGDNVYAIARRFNTRVDYIKNMNSLDDKMMIYPGQQLLVATVYKGNIIKNLIMDCQSYTKYRPNETTGGIFVSWRRKEELPTGA